MIEHDSDLWPMRRWGLQWSMEDGGLEARPFNSEWGRDKWVAQNPGLRQAVGKRHPVVKALRQQWRALALLEARQWKAKTGGER